MSAAPDPRAEPPVVQFIKVSKTFGSFVAVNDINFEIQRGEFFSLLVRRAAEKRPRSGSWRGSRSPTRTAARSASSARW
jgi:hypothetical protein